LHSSTWCPTAGHSCDLENAQGIKILAIGIVAIGFRSHKFESSPSSINQTKKPTMMKVFVALLLAVVASVAQGQVACFSHWTRAEKGTSGTNKFTGITNGTKTENYNNPLYYSLAAAQKGFVTGNLAKGRLSGALPITTYVGTITFDFFAKLDQIKITFTKKAGTGKIVSGKGCYAGITGTATRTLIGTTLPKVFEWKFCPTAKPSCTPS
jgi:hypothetical protein